LEVLAQRQQAHIDRLTQALEEAQRAGKRQAAPFRKPDGPTPDPKPPGRKPGDQHGPHQHRQALPPETVDEIYATPLPATCPHCGDARLTPTQVVSQYQTEIPRRPLHRRFDLQVGTCAGCGQRVQGRHPLQTSNALGAAASQLGPDAHAALVILNKELGLSHGKCAQVFRHLFGITIARTTSVRSVARTGHRCRAAAPVVQAAVRASDQVTADETGWRVEAATAWLHVFVGATATCYVIAPTRDHQPLVQVVGADWSGTLVHDGWAAYDRLTAARHQQCLAHLVRRCREMAAVASGGAVQFPRRVLAWVQAAFAVRRVREQGDLTADALVDAGLDQYGQLQRLLGSRLTAAANRKLARHLERHQCHWLRFVFHADTDATNWRAEHAIRPAVVNRKVWGGNRTWAGAQVQGTLMSILRTCWQRGVAAMDYLHRVLCSTAPVLIPASGGNQ
jgi:transposase